MRFVLDEIETELNTDQKQIDVLAQAADAITIARTIDEAAESVLNAACTVLPNAMVVLQIWHRENWETAEFSLIESTSNNNHQPSMKAVARLLEKDSSNGATQSKCQVALNQQNLQDLFPTIKNTPYNQGLKIILPHKATNKVALFLALAERGQPRLEQLTPFVSTLLNLFYLAESGIGSERYALEEHRLVVRAKQEWQRSVDTLGQMIFLVDESGKIIRANKTLEQYGLGQVTKVGGQSILELLNRLSGNPVLTIAPTPFQQRHNEDADKARAEQYNRLPVFTEWKKHWQAILDCGNTEWVIRNRCHEREYQVTMQSCAFLSTTPDEKKHHAVVAVEDITAKRVAERLLIDFQNVLEQDVREKTIQLKEINQRLQALSKELIQTQEKERKRVATDLHDGIGQMLSAIKLGIDNILLQIEPDAQVSKGQLKQVQKKIREALDEVRRICIDLRPPMLDDLGILATLQWFFREYQQMLPDIGIHSVIDIDEDDITAPLKTVIFRITQEALNNIFKHAHASRVLFRLTRINSRICLNIKDNGQGLDKENSVGVRYGFGLNNMQERALISGGRMDIKSTEGTGVDINVEWPLAD